MIIMNLSKQIIELETLLETLESSDMTVDEALPIYEKTIKKSKTVIELFNETKTRLENVSNSLNQLSFEDLNKE